jgi:hypothetical protein
MRTENLLSAKKKISMPFQTSLKVFLLQYLSNVPQTLGSTAKIDRDVKESSSAVLSWPNRYLH